MPVRSTWAAVAQTDRDDRRASVPGTRGRR
jgi:hypothetical protein